MQGSLYIHEGILVQYAFLDERANMPSLKREANMPSQLKEAFQTSDDGTTQELFPNLSKLAAICLMPMSTVDCEGGLSTLLCIKTDASNQFSS